MLNQTIASTCPNDADTTWVLVSSALVLGMMPGLSFFEAGLLRRKSAVSIITQVFIGLALMNLLWILVGFSLVFGGDHAGIIGDLRFAFFFNLSNRCVDTISPNIPVLVYAIFQMMFAAITPLVMTGAFAERIRLRGFLALIFFFELVKQLNNSFISLILHLPFILSFLIRILI